MSGKSKKDLIYDYRMMLEERIQQMKFSQRSASGLYAPIDYVMGQQDAKRIRPILTLLAQEYLSPTKPLVVMPAIALEVFHNFTLLHDDVMDHSLIRRGNPTVFAKFGLSSAILSGDAMLIEAYRLLMQDVEDQMIILLLPIFSSMAMKILEGQKLDMVFENRLYISEDEYLEMITLKTAELISTATHIGAILGGGDIEEIEAFRQLGLDLGILFQLQDDYLDLYGDKNVFGKQIGGDILAGKKTILHTLAYTQASAEQKEELRHYMQHPELLPQERIDAVKKVYDLLYIPDMVRQRIEERFKAISLSLMHLEYIRGRKADVIISLINSIYERSK